MKKTVRVLAALLLMLAVIAAAGFLACGSKEIPEVPSIESEQHENSENDTITTKTNPNDDGFGSEVGM